MNTITTVLLFLDFSGGELLVIFLAVFILFGPKKMPEIARKIAKVLNDVKRAAEKVKSEINEETKDISKEIKEIKDMKEIKEIKDINDKSSNLPG